MSRVTFDELLEAGAHFGHLTRKWNPAMAPYIFMERNGIHIIDLHKTVAKIDEAAEALKTLAAEGKTILFVGTKQQAQESIAELAKDAQMPYVVERWPGGMLTNFPTIRKTVNKMGNIDRMMSDGTFENLSKREKLQITRQREKLELNFGSIANMKSLPQAVFVVDVMKEHIAVKEAQRLGIPVFAIVDTNSSPKGIDYVIPANDASVDGVRIILSAVCDAIKEGLQERKIQKQDEDKDIENGEEGGENTGRRRRGVRQRIRRASDSEETPSADDAAATAPVSDEPASETKEAATEE
ncbi:MAG: 30S ribosomal protein S2 [Porphyromonas sp.]|nr:30S ribosomal protein S2 [Bacteroidales bacterium]MDY3100848.1 30S ribosomal protein S2 [Porphyromonas sp.]